MKARHRRFRTDLRPIAIIIHELRRDPEFIPLLIVRVHLLFEAIINRLSLIEGHLRPSYIGFALSAGRYCSEK